MRDVEVRGGRTSIRFSRGVLDRRCATGIAEEEAEEEETAVVGFCFVDRLRASAAALLDA